MAESITPPDLDAVLGARDVVTVTGPDARSYLQSQVTQDLQPIAVGETAWTFILAPNGRIECFAKVRVEADDRFVFDTDAGYGEALVERINRFKIRVDAEVELVEQGDPAANDELEAGRIDAGWPRFGTELVPGETIPGGTGLTRIAVSYTKGCYPGQELVERMDSRAAEAPKSLRRLDVDAGTQPGDDIVDGDAVVGTITSVAGTRALGWVKRNSDLGDVVQFG